MLTEALFMMAKTWNQQMSEYINWYIRQGNIIPPYKEMSYQALEGQEEIFKAYFK